MNQFQLGKAAREARPNVALEETFRMDFVSFFSVGTCCFSLTALEKRGHLFGAQDNLDLARQKFDEGRILMNKFFTKATRRRNFSLFEVPR